MRIESVEWDDRNRAHALIRATENEIDQAIRNAYRVTRNMKGRMATHPVHGHTSGGRHLIVAVMYDPERLTARPITAWEER